MSGHYSFFMSVSRPQSSSSDLPPPPPPCLSMYLPHRTRASATRQVHWFIMVQLTLNCGDVAFKGSCQRTSP